jgi:hypothetical protein
VFGNLGRINASQPLARWPRCVPANSSVGAFALMFAADSTLLPLDKTDVPLHGCPSERIFLFAPGKVRAQIFEDDWMHGNCVLK